MYSHLSSLELSFKTFFDKPNLTYEKWILIKPF